MTASSAGLMKSVCLRVARRMGAVTTYISAGLLVALLCAGALYSCERDRRIDAERSAAVSAETAKANALVQERTDAFREHADKAVVDLVKAKDALLQAKRDTDETVKKLVQANAEFRQWYSSTLPTDAVRLFNETRSASEAERGGK